MQRTGLARRVLEGSRSPFRPAPVSGTASGARFRVPASYLLGGSYSFFEAPTEAQTGWSEPTLPKVSTERHIVRTLSLFPHCTMTMFR